MLNIRHLLEKLILNLWYTKLPYAYLLLPLSALFYVISCLRRYYYQQLTRPVQFSAPIVVVGNITVGGSGKTPLVIWLAQWLLQQGFKPGIVSRGYGGEARQPIVVTIDSDPQQVGDEALLLARHTHCPVVVAPDRIAAVQTLLATHACTIIISDDGLQHYALDRQLEIAVLDGERLYGNKLLLPAGPLREPVARLQRVDLVVVNGDTKVADYFNMRLQPMALQNMRDAQQQLLLTDLQGKKIHAVAGIGNPQRFFASLRHLGAEVIEHSFSDHYHFQPSDLCFAQAQLPIVMTEKDAVKCQAFAQANYWYFPVTAAPSTDFIAAFNQILKEKILHEDN